MSSKKKVTQKASEPKPKYNIGQRAFALSYHKGKPEEIFEIEITDRFRRESPLRDFLGKKIGTQTTYSYHTKTPPTFDALPYGSLSENELYPSFVEVAKAFSQRFLTRLK